MNEKQGFSWGTFWAGIFTGAFLLFILLIVPAMLGANARRSVPTAGQSATTEGSDDIRARGDRLTRDEEGAMLMIEMVLRNCPLENNSREIADATVKRSRTHGIPLNRAFDEEFPIDEKLRARMDRFYRTQLDDLRAMRLN